MARFTSKSDTETLSLVCAEVWGGNRNVDHAIRMPGLRGHLFSHPLGGQRGGDVHHAAVCNSGLIARVVVADVVGHGDEVSAVSDELHDLLRRYLDTFDQRTILRQLNRRLADGGFGKLTTAAALTYFAPTHRLSVSYAGHPPGWYYSAAADRWERLAVPRAPDSPNVAPPPSAVGAPDVAPPPPAVARRNPQEALIDVPLALDRDARFTRHNRRVAHGDRVLLLTDGVLEGRGDSGELFGADRVGEVLNDLRGQPVDGLPAGFAAALGHFVADRPPEDDVTMLALEFVPGPTAMGSVWHGLRSRLTRPRGHVPTELAASTR